jgi:hypothetical protein
MWKKPIQISTIKKQIRMTDSYRLLHTGMLLQAPANGYAPTGSCTRVCSYRLLHTGMQQFFLPFVDVAFIFIMKRIGKLQNVHQKHRLHRGNVETITSSEIFKVYIAVYFLGTSVEL